MGYMSQDHLDHLDSRYGRLLVLDDIIQFRKADAEQSPILAYPKNERSVAEFEYFTARDLDRMIDGNVKKFIELGLGPRAQSEKKLVVAILAPSTLDFVISFFTISRLGHVILTLSPRLAPVAIANLLRENDCHHLIYGETIQIKQNLAEAQESATFQLYNLPGRDVYDTPAGAVASTSYFCREFDRETANREPCVIIHSSGSTGLPKSIALSHRALLQHPIFGPGLHNFNALPWYHVHGIGSALQAMYFGKTAHMWNAALPMTAESIVHLLEVVKPGAFHTVPYILGLVAQSDKGVELLKRCAIVTAAGARTPDELGNRLVAAGVKFGVLFGMTEAGLLGDSTSRPQGDDAWDYIRVANNIRKYVHFDLQDQERQEYEAIYLPGHPALCAHNTNHPEPGSWSSKDIFTPHPTIQDAWKYLGRIDDRVTLVNGEKVLPLPIEGRIRNEPCVRDCAVVGIDRPVPGLLVFRAPELNHLQDPELIETLWPAVEDANSRAEAFSQIAKDMIAVIPSSVDYPKTDKGSIIRKQVYRQFEREIDSLYQNVAKSVTDGTSGNGAAQVSFTKVADLQAFLVSAAQTELGLTLAPDADFFAAGVDSLKAIQLRRYIQDHVALAGTELPQNVVYDCGSVRRLAGYLIGLQRGEHLDHNDKAQDLRNMQDMIERYSIEARERSTSKSRSGNTYSVILTGATGSIGAHLLSQLLAIEELDTVWCFCRGADADRRVRESLAIRKLTSSPSCNEVVWSKVKAVEANPALEGFGLDADTLSAMQQTVGLIIHGAWPVNFNISLATFEEHIRGLHNLLQFSMDVNRAEPAHLVFCSSISVALSAPVGTTVPDAPVSDPRFAVGTGYSQSKYVGEQIVLDAAKKGADAFSVRIGQVVGDTRAGVWNDTDSYPLIVRAATVLKVMPDIQETCQWLPVDTLATAVIDIAMSLRHSRSLAGSAAAETAPRVYNLVNPTRFEWQDLIAELRKHLDFEVVPLSKWLALLESSAQGPEVRINPATKLAGYFAELYGSDGSNGASGGVGGVRFEVKAARECSEAMQTPPDVLREGLVGKFLANWLPKWQREVEELK